MERTVEKGDMATVWFDRKLGTQQKDQRFGNPIEDITDKAFREFMDLFSR